MDDATRQLIRNLPGDVRVRRARDAGRPRADQWRRRPLQAFLLLFVALFITWIIFSGMFDAFHLSLGAASSALAAWLCRDFFPPTPGTASVIGVLWRSLRYAPWFLKEVAKANLHLLALVFHPRMMERIDPQLVRFQSRLQSRLGLTVLANSITLTPGTIAVSLNERRIFTVHAIDRPSAEGVPGEMENRVARTFGETIQDEEDGR
jgi:multicomponent Na+:H+ antiporter subunit E